MTDDLRALSDAATPGPWTHDEAFDASFICAGPPDEHVSQSWVLRMDSRPGRRQDKRNAAFIVAAVNHVRAVLVGRATPGDGADGPCLCGHPLSAHLDERGEWTVCQPLARCGCIGYTEPAGQGGDRA